MLGVDPEIGTSVLRLWVAAGAAALLVALCVFAFARPRTSAVSFLARSGVVAIGAILGATMAWAILDHTSLRDHDPDRRALEMRAQELAARAIAPGSPLACLDELAGESVEIACEKALFASPATVATAVSYVAARLALLADLVAYRKHGGEGIDAVLQPLRRSLETDRFGFIARALAERDGCSSQDCKALALLHDPSHVRANLSGETLDRYLEHYSTVWAQSSDGPVADATRIQPTAAQLAAAGPRKVLVNIDFPTAASIPPISIMNPEPTTRLPGVAAAAAANPNPPAVAAPRRPRKQAATPPSPPEPGPEDPVYLPASAAALPGPVPPPPAATAAPTPYLAAGVGAPVQLNPFASPPEANAGTAQRAQ